MDRAPAHNTRFITKPTLYDPQYRSTFVTGFVKEKVVLSPVRAIVKVGDEPRARCNAKTFEVTKTERMFIDYFSNTQGRLYDPFSNLESDGWPKRFPDSQNHPAGMHAWYICRSGT